MLKYIEINSVFSIYHQVLQHLKPKYNLSQPRKHFEFIALTSTPINPSRNMTTTILKSASCNCTLLATKFKVGQISGKPDRIWVT